MKETRIKKILPGLGFLLLFLLQAGFSQGNIPSDPDMELLEKYWLLREHQYQYWVRWGECGQGFGHIGTRWEKDAGANQNRPSGKPMMGTGDGSAHQGQYVGMLAIEYDQLVRYGQPTDTTVRELYFALNDIFRLDLSSGDYGYESPNSPPPPVWPQCTQSSRAGAFPCLAAGYETIGLNGFFIRSDAPPNFYQPFGIDSCQSDLTTLHGNNCQNKEESYDQAIQVLHGLMLVNRLCTNVNYNGVNFADFASFEAELIVEHIRKESWRVTNPHRLDSLVQRGHQARYYAFALSKFLKNQYGRNYTDNWTIFSRPLWQHMQHTPWAPGQSINEHMIMTTAAISNSWYFCRPIAPIIQPLIPNCWIYPQTINTTPEGLERWGVYNKKELYYLTHKILYPNNHGASHISWSYCRNLLQLAPCDSIRSPWPGTTQFYGWTSTNKYFVPRIDRDGNGGYLDVMREGKNRTLDESYSGVDYCILYNAWSRAYTDNTDYYNLFDARVDRTYPFPVYDRLFGTIVTTKEGSLKDPRVIRSLNRISTKAYLQNNSSIPVTDSLESANLWLVARNEIKLEPGFTIEPGAEFNAIISGDPIPCQGSSIQKQNANAAAMHYLDSVWACTDSIYESEQAELLKGEEWDFQKILGHWEALDSSGSNQLSYQQVLEAPEIEVFPQPARDQVSIRFIPNLFSSGSVELISGNGNLLIREPLAEQTLNSGGKSLNIEFFPSGIYLIKITLNGHPFFNKLIIQK